MILQVGTDDVVESAEQEEFLRWRDYHQIPGFLYRESCDPEVFVPRFEQN